MLLFCAVDVVAAATDDRGTDPPIVSLKVLTLLSIVSDVDVVTAVVVVVVAVCAMPISRSYLKLSRLCAGASWSASLSPVCVHHHT